MENSSKLPRSKRETSGLGQPEQFRRLDLLEAALANDLVDPGDQFRLEQVRFGLRESQVREHVSAAAFDLHFVVFIDLPSAVILAVVLLGRPEPAFDQIDLLLRRRNAPLGLLLEGVQDIDGGLEPDRVDRPVGVAVVT